MYFYPSLFKIWFFYSDGVCFSCCCSKGVILGVSCVIYYVDIVAPPFVRCRNLPHWMNREGRLNRSLMSSCEIMAPTSECRTARASHVRPPCLSLSLALLHTVCRCKQAYRVGPYSGHTRKTYALHLKKEKNRRRCYPLLLSSYDTH